MVIDVLKSKLLIVNVKWTMNCEGNEKLNFVFLSFIPTNFRNFFWPQDTACLGPLLNGLGRTAYLCTCPHMQK